MARTSGRIFIKINLQKINDIASRRVQEAALAILSNLRDAPPVGTPIDTRWAANNWRVSIDHPNEGQIDPPKPKPKSGTRPLVPLDRVGADELRSFDLSKNRLIYIQNNAPYILKLANGHSRQQPSAGWVDGCIDAGLAFVGLLRGK